MYFLIRKIERIRINKKQHALHYFKDISYEDVYNCFANHLAVKYPETMINKKYCIVY